MNISDNVIILPCESEHVYENVCDLACVHEYLYVYDGDCVHDGVHACGHVCAWRCVCVRASVHVYVGEHVCVHWYVDDDEYDVDVCDEGDEEEDHNHEDEVWEEQVEVGAWNTFQHFDCYRVQSFGVDGC